MAIYRPRIIMSYHEQTICNLRRLVKRFPHHLSDLKMHERMRLRLREKYQIECCDLARRALSERKDGR